MQQFSLAISWLRDRQISQKIFFMESYYLHFLKKLEINTEIYLLDFFIKSLMLYLLINFIQLIYFIENWNFHLKLILHLMLNLI